VALRHTIAGDLTFREGMNYIFLCEKKEEGLNKWSALTRLIEWPIETDKRNIASRSFVGFFMIYGHKCQLLFRFLTQICARKRAWV